MLVVRPGFVTTRMTRGLPVPPLSTDPASVARATVRGLRRGAHTVWAPPPALGDGVWLLPCPLLGGSAVSPCCARGTGEWASGQRTVEGWSAVEHTPRHRVVAALPTVAARGARRRRLRLFDLALGIVLALAAIVLAPGLAVVALLAAGRAARSAQPHSLSAESVDVASATVDPAARRHPTSYLKAPPAPPSAHGAGRA